MGKKIVVIGAGYAGLLITKKLEKKLKGQDVDITIIDKNTYHTMLTELHEVAACRVDESSIRINIKKIFAHRNVNVVLDNVVTVDYQNQVIKGVAGTYNYDFLVIATGCKQAYFDVPGAEEHSFGLWSHEEAVNLRDHIHNVVRLAANETDINKRKALLTFYVVGSGFSGVEMVGELAEYMPVLTEKYKIDMSEVNIHNVDYAHKVMTMMPDKSTDRAANRLEKMGVKLSMKTMVTEVKKDSIVYSNVTDIDEEKVITEDSTYTVIWTAGTQGSDLARDSSELGLKEKTGGRIQTDKYLRSINHPNVYVGGDNIYYVPEGETESVPQTVENCEHCAKTISKNIVEEVNGKAPTNEYTPQFKGFMVCIGGAYGTAYGGLPGKFFVMPSFFAMFAKHFINIIYFFEILGWNKVFSYLSTEIFTIRNKRSFVGGHFSNRSSLFMLLPLRLWLGMYFIYYAYVRYVFGWLDRPLLYGMFRDVANQFRPPLMEFSLFNEFRFSMSIVDNVNVTWFQATPVSWFLENYVLATYGQQMFWQLFIVALSVLLGVLFIAGLFTTLASIITLAYATVIVITLGIPIYTVWLFFAPFAFICTGGKVLSLDYYVIPWLKKKWSNIRFVKKWYLYHD